MAENNTIDLAKWTIEQAQKAGADQASVRLSKKREVEVSYRKGELDKLQENTKKSLTLNVYVDNRYLGSSTNDLKKDSLKTMITEAVASAKYLPKDEHRLLPDPKYYPESPSVLEMKDPAYESIDTSRKKKIAAKLEKAAMSYSDKIISATSGYSDSKAELTIANSNGFIGSYHTTDFSIYTEAGADGGDGTRPEAWDWAWTRFINDLPDPELIAKIAARRALAKIGQSKIESCKCDMIVENRMVGGRLLEMLRRAATGRSLQQKQSFLEGMVGKKIGSKKLTIIDDPLLEKGLGSRPFDGQGLASKKRVMVDRGVLRHYYIDNYYGRKLGMELTTAGPSNIIIPPGEKNLEQMIAGCYRAIIVRGFIGGNSNSTTGDFSMGVVGELIENGNIVKPISEMNIAGNAIELWSSLYEVGSDTLEYSQNRTPSLLFKDVSFSGI